MRLYNLAYHTYGKVMGAAKPLPIWRLPIGGATLGELADALVMRLLAPRKDLRVALGWGDSMLIPKGFADALNYTDAAFDKETVTLFQQIVREGMTVASVGASVGYFALLASHLVGPKGKVYAFEPHPLLHTYIVKNAKMNGYDHMVAVPQAISDRVGQVSFFVGTRLGTSSLFYHYGLGRKPIRVRATTLDEFFRGEGYPKVDVIKMNIEGSEKAAVEGMGELSRRNPGLKLIVEYCPSALEAAATTPGDLFDALLAQGFTDIRAVTQQGLRAIDPRNETSALLTEKGPEPAVNLFCQKE